MITIDECEARIWNDTRLIAEALNDCEHLHWSLKVIHTDRDPMSRNERAWDALCFAVRCRAESMADELNSQRSLNADDEWADDPRNAPGYAKWVAGS